MLSNSHLPSLMIVDALVEGPTDEAVARRLVAHTGHQFGTCFGKRGCGFVRSKVSGVSQRARFGIAVLTLIDHMDFDYLCPGALVGDWMPNRPAGMLLRVVVRELESWLLADQEGVASYLHVSSALVPDNPEQENDPKQSLLNLARRSRKKRIRDAFVPAPGVSATVGPGYVGEVENFVFNAWNIEAASVVSSSLNRCLLRLRELPSDH